MELLENILTASWIGFCLMMSYDISNNYRTSNRFKYVASWWLVVNLSSSSVWWALK